MPGWGPDGRTVYYVAYDDRRRGSIWSVPVDGREPTMLVRFDDPSRPSLGRDFAIDGKRVYLGIAQPQRHIQLMELTGKRASAPL